MIGTNLEKLIAKGFLLPPSFPRVVHHISNEKISGKQT